jgi:type I restriction enzyme, S subunit
MDVKPGYQQTEVGVIPEDWQIATLAALFDFQNGVNADKSAYGRGLPFVNVLEAITYSHLYGPEIPGKVTLSQSAATSYSVERGDVLFNRTSEVQEEIGLAATYLGADRVVFGGFVIRGRPRDRRLFPSFSGYALRSSLIRSQIIPMGQGAIRANIGQQNLGSVVVPMPSFVEQEAIAEALSDADALIESLEQLISKKRAIKLGAMQELLTGRRRLPGFTDEWESNRLGRIGTFLKGKGIRKDQVSADGLPCIRYGEIYTDHNDHIRQFQSFIRADVASESQRLRKGDVLFAGSGETAEEIGKCVAFLGDMEAYAGGDIVILRPVGQDSKYLGYILNHPLVANQKAQPGQGDAVVHISARNLARLHVCLPKSCEQKAIAAVLSDMDDEIAALEQTAAKARLVKQGMMQELLTGRTRLV